MRTWGELRVTRRVEGHTVAYDFELDDPDSTGRVAASFEFLTMINDFRWVHEGGATVLELGPFKLLPDEVDAYRGCIVFRVLPDEGAGP